MRRQVISSLDHCAISRFKVPFLHFSQHNIFQFRFRQIINLGAIPIIRLISINTIGIGCALSYAIQHRTVTGKGEVFNDIFRNVQTLDFSIVRIATENPHTVLVFCHQIYLSVSFVPNGTAHSRIEIFCQGFCLFGCQIINKQLDIVLVRQLSFADIQTDIIKCFACSKDKQLLAIRRKQSTVFMLPLRPYRFGFQRLQIQLIERRTAEWHRSINRFACTEQQITSIRTYVLNGS